MDPEIDFVAPVRIATRRVAPVAPEDAGLVGVDPPEPFYSITFDPGGTTGWSVFAVWPEAMHDGSMKILNSLAFWSAGEFTGPEANQVDAMMGLIEAWPEEAYLTTEDFILQQFSMARDLLAPVRINARLDDRLHVATLGARTCDRQMPSMALRSVTDERLKAWGFWNSLPGQPHARDAVRHNITRLRRLKEQWMKDDAAAERVV